MEMIEKKYELIVSEDLKQILKEFESESVGAQLLLQKEHCIENLVERPANYISISKDGIGPGRMILNMILHDP